MALSKQITLASGVQADYFRIDSIVFARGRISCTIGVYKDATLAASGAAPLASQRAEFESVSYTNSLVDNGQLLPTAYAAIKAYANSPEIPGIEISKGLLQGPFSDV